MRRYLVLFIVYILFIPIFAQQNKTPPKHLSYSYLKSIFPYHLVLSLEDKFYLYMPHMDGFNPDLVFAQKSNKYIVSNWNQVNDYIVFPAKDSINIARLYEDDLYILIPILNNLIYKIKCIGTPLFNNVQFHSNADTWMIRNNGEQRIKEEIKRSNQAFNILNKQWKDHDIYVKLVDFKKVDGHIEFFINVIAEKRIDKTKDFCDIRFHTDLECEIDLIMFFLYENVD